MKGVKKISGITSFWARSISRVLNLNITVHSEADLNINGLIVSNHLSYIDILAHASIFNIRFAPKSDIAKWFFIGWMVNTSKPVWVNRSSRTASLKTSQEFSRTLDRGINLIVYPEGTTTNGKSGILPFKSTPFESSIASNAPVIPVLIRYRDPGAENDICWHGDMPFFSHMWELLAKEKVNIDLYILKPVYPTGMTRKELSDKIYGIMSDRWNSITF